MLGTGESLRLKVAQLPFDAADRWVGLPPEEGKDVQAGKLSLVVHAAATLKVDQPLCGLLVDEWVEVVPSSKETTAIAFQFNPPDACAPQSVLLAVPPIPDQPWTVASLHRVLLETLDLAKLRAVDAEALGEIGHYMPALFFALQHERRSRLDRLRAADEIAHGQTTSRRPDRSRRSWPAGSAAIRRIGRRDRSFRHPRRRRRCRRRARILRSRAGRGSKFARDRPTCA